MKGFNFKGEYYHIDGNSVIYQYDKPFIFYKEGISAPIDFGKSKYVNDTYDIVLNGENLKDLVDGKAFKGIVNLGKDDNSFWKFFDWKMGVIALGIIILAYLHLTGQIDIVEMFGIGG